MAESEEHLIEDGAKKNSRTGKFTIFGERYQSDLDQQGVTSEWFKTSSVKFQTQTEAYTLDEWRKKLESLQGKRYTLTLTWDPKNIVGIQYDVVKQWRKLRTIVYQLSCKYHFRYYLVPELHESGDRVHCHGLIVFPLGNGKSNYKIMRERSFTMEKLQKQIGQMVQNHQIHSLYQPYDSYGYEGHRQTKKKNVTLQKWHEYCHSLTEAKVKKENVIGNLGITTNFTMI